MYVGNGGFTCPPPGIVSPTDVRTIPSTISHAEYSTGLTVQNSYRPETISARPAASRSTPATLTRSDRPASSSVPRTPYAIPAVAM